MKSKRAHQSHFQAQSLEDAAITGQPAELSYAITWSLSTQNNQPLGTNVQSHMPEVHPPGPQKEDLLRECLTHYPLLHPGKARIQGGGGRGLFLPQTGRRLKNDFI